MKTPDDFRRLSWFWFAFPGRARVAFRYEQFLNGVMRDQLEALGVVVRVKPASLLP